MDNRGGTACASVPHGSSGSRVSPPEEVKGWVFIPMLRAIVGPEELPGCNTSATRLLNNAAGEKRRTTGRHIRSNSTVQRYCPVRLGCPSLKCERDGCESRYALLSRAKLAPKYYCRVMSHGEYEVSRDSSGHLRPRSRSTAVLQIDGQHCRARVSSPKEKGREWGTRCSMKAQT